MVSIFWISTFILICWFVLGIILTFLVIRLYIDGKLSHIDIQSILYLYFIVVLILALLMVIYQEPKQAYTLTDTGCQMSYCHPNDTTCFTDQQCKKYQQSSLYIIQAYTPDNDDTRYLTITDDGKLILAEPDNEDLYYHQLWELLDSNGEPFFIDYSTIGNINVSIRSVYNPEFCISDTNVTVICSEANAFNNFISNKYTDTSQLKCLNHIKGIIGRDRCSLGSDQWVLIPIR